MRKSFVLLLCLSGYCLAGPVGTKRNMPIVQHRDENSFAASSMESLVESEPAAMAEPEIPMMSTLTLPSNATSIRADITDSFSCENKTYGYYADVDNDCQIFHVCLPVTYADGKENTFRWSFICPEETIFSQDSFTCMRPDDMTITCDDSFQYYELNRNFGMVESNKDNTEMAAETENNESNEIVMEAENQPEPVIEEELEKEAPKPVQQAVKVQKPNRRKPGVSYATQNKPKNSFPLRKLPQVQPVVPEMNNNKVSEDKNETENPVKEEEEEAKPLVQKLSRRPVSAVTNALKDKIESSKPDSMNGVRTQFFNQNRKRPSMFKKKPLEQHEEPQQEMIPIQVESQTEQQTFSILESDMSNNNAETQVADSVIQASENNEIFVSPEEPKEAEASMTHEDSNKVDEIPNENVNIEEPQQVLEAFEEIPAFISEVLETQPSAEEENKITEQLPFIIAEKPHITQESENAKESQSAEQVQNTEASQNSEKFQNAEESQIVKEPQNIEESKKDEEQATEYMKTIQGSDTMQESQTVEQQIAEETKLVEDSQIVDETATSEDIEGNNKVEEHQPFEEHPLIENIKPVEEALFVEEPQYVEAVAPMEYIQTAEESQKTQKTQTVVEDKPEPEIFSATEELVKTNAVAEPAIFENSDEGLAFAPSQTIEEMEDERPADAPESMQATDDMSYPSPMVQQMMDDLEDNKHSVGGFKPVDPVMAHEAEQLIADFINTLRKNDFTNETPGMIRHQYNKEESEKEQEQPHNNISVVEEAQKITKEEAAVVSDTTEEEESEKVQPHPEVAEMQDNNAEEMVDTKLEAQTVSQENIDEKLKVAKKEPQALSQENNVEEMEDNKEEAQTLSQENNAEEMEVTKEEPQILSQENNAEDMENIKEESAEAQPEIMAEENTDNHESIALKSLEAQSSENIEESTKSNKQQAGQSNMMVINNMPEKMYQIPVQVISAPEEEMPVFQQESQAESDTASENKPIDMNASTEDKLEETVPAAVFQPESQAESDTASEEKPIDMTIKAEDKLEETIPAAMMGGYKPLSIDDIVELVKERLDHMPKDEMETPMQLEQVLGNMQEDKVSEEKEEAVEEEAKPPLSEEEIVMPIYQRTVQPVKVEAGAETQPQEQDLSIEQSEVAATDVKEKSNRSYRSRSMLTPKMDTRKRRFLFKSDKNKSS